MIRLKISNFIRKHKGKIKDLTRKLIIVAMWLFIATIILSSLSNLGIKDEESEDKYEVYKPTETIIRGQEVSKEQFEKDSNLVNTFLDFCNEGKVEEAYNLISDACKEESYPTLEKFKENYYNPIFYRKRECNLQAWISESKYIVYKVRYANNMMATGTYDETDIFQDYITLNRKNEKEKISIGNFVDFENLNIVTKTDEIEATVLRKKIYVSYEEYDIKIRNITDKTILLDDLNSSQSIKLIVESGTEHRADINKLDINDLLIRQNETKTIALRFKKNFSSGNTSKQIEFTDIITDYYNYKANEDIYTNTSNITIKVEG